MEQISVDSYISGKLREGVSPEEIKQHLQYAGWSDQQIREVLSRSLIASGVPSPAQHESILSGKSVSAVEVMINFFSFIILGIIATAFGILYYQIINHFFPDPLSVVYGSYDASRSAMHYAMSALFIGFPVYLLVISYVMKRFYADPERQESTLSKWLTYLVLLIAAVTIIGDLITTIYFFLQGEITMRFFLKALVILVISGAVFGFYFFERKAVQFKHRVSRCVFRAFAFGASVLVVAGIVTGFVAGGSPATERARGLDTQRSSDLSRIADCVNTYGQTYHKLPGSLSELEKSQDVGYCPGSIVDPETAVPYGYTVINQSQQQDAVVVGTFELCAEFALDSETGTTLPAHSYGDVKTKWSDHRAGHACDEQVVVLQDLSNTGSAAPGTIVPLPAK